MPWGEVGEICARGYCVMKGYYHDDILTQDTIDDDGWILTGDLGYFDEDGYIKLIGRSKDMIIRGGEPIYPLEIEKFLFR